MINSHLTSRPPLGGTATASSRSRSTTTAARTTPSRCSGSSTPNGASAWKRPSSSSAARTVAVVLEQSPEMVDAAMSGVGGTVLRRPGAEVEAEIASVEEAERKAKREARKELLRARHAHDKAAVKAKIGELKARLHRGESPRHGRRGRDRRSVARRIGGRQTARHSGGRARADPRRSRHMRTCVAQQRLHAR